MIKIILVVIAITLLLYSSSKLMDAATKEQRLRFLGVVGGIGMAFAVACTILIGITLLF